MAGGQMLRKVALAAAPPSSGVLGIRAEVVEKIAHWIDRAPATGGSHWNLSKTRPAQAFPFLANGAMQPHDMPMGI
ncbi:hypothetical protein QCN27_05760 [Cereibacter sp. SYSU M97828]|nr:hypothetical protein [Cereibacter flavus]